MLGMKFLILAGKSISCIPKASRRFGRPRFSVSWRVSRTRSPRRRRLSPPPAGICRRKQHPGSEASGTIRTSVCGLAEPHRRLVGGLWPAKRRTRVIPGRHKCMRKSAARTSGDVLSSRFLSGLLDWGVSATASYGFVDWPHDGFVNRYREDRQDALLREGDAVRAVSIGVQHPLTCEADFDAMLDTAVPRFRAHQHTGFFRT